MYETNGLKLGTVKFDRTDTKAIKGVTVLLMLFHHLAGFPERFPVGFVGFSEFIQQLAAGGKMCVAVFFFLGGYGLYINWKKGEYSVVDTILRIYQSFWKVFVIFVPIAIVFFRRWGNDINPLCSRYVFTQVNEMVTTVVAASLGFSGKLNGEWWFLKCYVFTVPLGYLFCCIWKKQWNIWTELVSVFALDLFFRDVIYMDIFAPLQNNLYFGILRESYGYSSAYFAGIVVAKYNGISKMKHRISQLSGKVWFSLLGVFVVFWSRCFKIYDKADILCCMLLVPMLSVILDNITPLKTIFTYLGKHSTNLWLIHSFYCYYFLEVTKVVYATTNVWIDLLILLALSLVSSIAVNLFWSMIGKVHLKIYATKLR